MTFSPASSRISRKNGKFIGEGVFRRKDGSEFILEWQVVPLMDTDGRPRYWLGIQRDASRWKDAEKGRRAAEEMYRQLVENQPDLICRFLPDTTLTFVNAAYANFFQRERQDLIGKRFLEFLSDEDAHRVRESLAAVTTQNPFSKFEHETTGADGRTYWHVWNDQATFDENGMVLFFQSVGTDITERKHAEDALRESEARIRTITDALPSRIAYVDRDYRYRFNNKAYETCFGIDRKAIHGKPVREIIGDENFARVKDKIDRALRGEAIRYEYVNIKGDIQKVEEITYIPDVDADPARQRAFTCSSPMLPTASAWKTSFAHPRSFSTTFSTRSTTPCSSRTKPPLGDPERSGMCIGGRVQAGSHRQERFRLFSRGPGELPLGHG